jgi:hypothetical protein
VRSIRAGVVGGVFCEVGSKDNRRVQSVWLQLHVKTPCRIVEISLWSWLQCGVIKRQKVKETHYVCYKFVGGSVEIGI